MRSTSRPSSSPFYALRIGATMELGRSGRPTMTMSASPGRGGGVRAQRGTYGVFDQRRPNSAAVTWGAWPRSFYDVWSGCSARLGTISRIWPRYPFSLPSTRAREASGAMSTDLFDRREPAGRQMVRSTSRPSSSPFYALRIGATMELGRSGRPTMTMSASPGRGGGVRAQRGTYGVFDQRRPNSAAVTWGAWPRSFYDVWSGCSARLGTISRIWPRYPFSLPSTRAREASGAMSTDLFDRREPAGRQMVRSTSRPSSSPFYALRIGATMELGRSGRPTMTMSASPGRGGGVRAQRGTYGVFDQRRPNSAAVTWGAWPRSFYDVWSGCSARLGTISRIWPRYPFSLPSTRAREASGAMSTDLFDRREPAGRQMVRSTSRPSSSSFLRIADRGDDGARAVGPTDDDDVGFAWSGRRRASAARYLRGLRSTPAKFCSSDMGRLASLVLRCLVGVQRAARNDQQNLAALSILVAFNARA